MNVDGLEEKKDIEGLGVLLKYGKESFTRSSAALALGRIGDAGAIEPLIAGLKDKDSNVRLVAAEALGKIGDARAVEPLIAVLKDSDSSARLRLVAAETLGKIDAIRAVEPLIAVLKDRDSSARLRRVAAETLGKIDAIRAVQPLISVLSDIDVHLEAFEALSKIGKSAVEPAIVALENEYSEVRRNAAEVLDMVGWKPETSKTKLLYYLAKQQLDVSNVQELRSEIDISGLIQILKYSDKEDVCKSAAEALGEISEALGEAVYGEMTDTLIVALKHKYSSVREAAAKALGFIPTPHAIEALIVVLGDDIFLDALAAKALVNIGIAAVGPLIAALVADEWEYINGYIEAVRALGNIGDTRAIEPILRICFRHPGVAEYISTRDALLNLASRSNLPVNLMEIACEAARIHTIETFDDVYESWEESDKAIQFLCSLNSLITSNLLHLVSEKGIKLESSYLVTQRSIARAELARRGNPTYQPDIFI